MDSPSGSLFGWPARPGSPADLVYPELIAEITTARVISTEEVDIGRTGVNAAIRAMRSAGTDCHRRPARIKDQAACRRTTQAKMQSSPGGSDFDLDRHHAQTDAPMAGRLVNTPLGQGQFTFTVVRGTDKWATRS